MASNAQSEALLKEGARSYPKALLALSEFRRLVQERCCDGMKRHLKEVGEALGVRLERREVKPHAGPSGLDSQDVDGTWANLGAKLAVPGSEWTLWDYVFWAEGTIRVYVSLEFPDAEVAERVQAVTGPYGTSLDSESKEVYLQREVKPDDFSCLDSIIDQVNLDWICVWRKAAGVKQFLGKTEA